MPDGWVLGITDDRGVLISRSHRAEQHVGKPASAVFLEAMRRGDGQPLHGHTLDGVPSTSVVLPVHGGNWFLGIGVADAVLNQGLTASLRFMAVLAMVWLGLALGLSQHLASRLLRQVRLLVQMAGPREAQPGGPASTPGWDGRQIEEFATVLDGIEDARDRERLAQTERADAIGQRDEVFDLYERAPCGYHSLDRDGRVLRMNETELGWLGLPRDQVIGRPYTDLLSEASRARFAQSFPVFQRTGRIENLEFDLVRADGTLLPVSVSGTAIRDADGQLLSTRSTVFDITERKRLEARLAQQARTDALTGLANRRDFDERALLELQRARRLDRPLTLLMLDLDHFKHINDRHGHATGDQVLQGLAQVCLAQLRDIDLLARLGGEEFAVVLPETNPGDGIDVAQRLRRAVAAASLGDADHAAIACTVSIGVAWRTGRDDTVDSLLDRADQALYAAKRGGRNRVEVAELPG